MGPNTADDPKRENWKMNEESEVEEFGELIERFDHAMLVSVAADHSLHARPMAIAGHEGAVLRFATSRQSTKAAEVVHRPRVAVVMQGGGAYLTIAGMASLSDDANQIEALWQPSWKLWFPEGPGDSRLVLIEVAPERAEYWDRGGIRRLEYYWEAGKALARGRAVDDSKLSGHHKFSFG
jgi:general stress protein 26